MKPADLAKTLLDKYKIWTAAWTTRPRASMACASRRTCSFCRESWTCW